MPTLFYLSIIVPICSKIFTELFAKKEFHFSRVQVRLKYHWSNEHWGTSPHSVTLAEAEGPWIHFQDINQADFFIVKLLDVTPWGWDIKQSPPHNLMTNRGNSRWSPGQYLSRTSPKSWSLACCDKLVAAFPTQDWLHAKAILPA